MGAWTAGIARTMRLAVVVGVRVVIGVGLVEYEFAGTEDLGDRAEAVDA